MVSGLFRRIWERSGGWARTSGPAVFAASCPFAIQDAVKIGFFKPPAFRFLNYVNGTFFDLSVMIQLMAILVVGGIGTLWGPVLGAVLLIWVLQNLGTYAEYSQLIFGLLYGGALLFLPGGVVGEVAARLKR
jgi:hypothetical protein